MSIMVRGPETKVSRPCQAGLFPGPMKAMQVESWPLTLAEFQGWVYRVLLGSIPDG